MTEDQQEAFNTVKKLNDILYEKYSTSKNLDIDYLPIFSITFAAHYFFH